MFQTRHGASLQWCLSEQDAKPAAWLRLTHYKDFAILAKPLKDGL